MRILISGVGTRGDVQPVLALAVALRDLGHVAALCIPPNFMEWAAQLGFEATPVGVAMRAPAPGAPLPVIGDLVTDQFVQVEGAARGCDAIVGAGAFQFAARTIAERLGVPYVNALYAPVSIPSPELPPAAPPGQPWARSDAATHLQLWEGNARVWNERFLARINANRGQRGAAPLADVRSHILADQPLLAADATLAPLPATPGLDVLQTGAWLLPDASPLADALAAFLTAGPPPLYFGFGSMPAAPSLGRTVVEAARTLGRRALVAQGWAGLEASDAADCFVTGDVNQQALFPRVAAVVHHGGAGTTTTAARAGVPQVITPMFSDQFYFASRVHELGIGATTPSAELTAESLAAALREALAPSVAARARDLAAKIATDGAAVAAREVVRRAAR